MALGTEYLGYCVDSTGEDINAGVIQARDSGSWTKDDCKSWCQGLLITSITACEYIVNHGCLAHRHPSVARGSGVVNHYCWPAFKSNDDIGNHFNFQIDVTVLFEGTNIAFE